MTVSFADQFDIPQVSKKYSVILKRLRGCVLTRFLWFRTFAHENLKNRLAWKQKVGVSAFCGATCNPLCISCLTEIRVMVFITLKMPKALIVSGIRAARPGGSCQTALCLIKL